MCIRDRNRTHPLYGRGGYLSQFSIWFYQTGGWAGGDEAVSYTHLNDFLGRQSRVTDGQLAHVNQTAAFLYQFRQTVYMSGREMCIRDRGNVILMQEPFPSMLLKLSFPLCTRTSFPTRSSPMPLPVTLDLIALLPRKCILNSFFCSEAGIPIPVSVTSILQVSSCLSLIHILQGLPWIASPPWWCLHPCIPRNGRLRWDYILSY